MLESDKISSYEKQYMMSMLNGEAHVTYVSCAFLNLSRMLHLHYGMAPIIIIDEYDTPVQLGYVHGYYNKIVDFMRILLSSGLKDNSHLAYGFLSGIMHIAKGDVLGGLNNIKDNSILDNRYSEYFGFTTEEVRKMAEYYGASEKYEELFEWYGGYRLGKTEMFNPRSVIEYFNNECTTYGFQRYTENNDIISVVLSKETAETYEQLESLMQGKSLVMRIDTGVSCSQLWKDPSAIYSLLLVAGYLTAVTNDQSFGDFMCEIALPNKEIFYETMALLKKHFICYGIDVTNCDFKDKR